MKLGLFGGTFDPIHLGHLRSAEEVREAFRLDLVLFIPASIQPLKKGAAAPASDRLAMARLAVRGNPAFAVSDIELRRPGKSFSIDTLGHFAAHRKGDRLYCILGMDAFRHLGAWKDFQAIFPLAHLIVTSRPGSRELLTPADLPVAARKSFCYDPKKNAHRHESGTLLYFLKLTDIAVSASEVRARARAGKSIRYLVPPAVERYIERRGLYRFPKRNQRRGEKL